jgi:NTE family protein
MLDLALGAVGGGGNAHSLLDASPLRHYLSRNVPWNGIEESIRSGDLYALAISATNYHSGKSYLFIQGQQGHPMWNRVRRVTLATDITADHVCASAAIPIVFQPVKLETPAGPAFFGDGCARLQQPLSPAIRLGANKLLAIGVQCENSVRQRETADQNDPSLAQIVGVLFNVMFLDHLSTDIEHLERLNQLVAGGRMRQQLAEGSEEVHRIAVLAVTPSVDLSSVAQEHQGDMPYLIQHFIGGLGRDAASCADLMSYLLFTSKFTRALVQIGYEDTGKRVDEIEAFLFSGVVARKRNVPPLKQTA